jgi:hypothetical protein
MKTINYRKLYEQKIGKIPDKWDIHHIDFNHDNNDLDNLIPVPRMVHTIIHQSGFIPRDEIESLIQIYEINKQT